MLACGAVEADRDVLQAACAAIEMVHTASLCHDDVVDNAEMRRTMPALWRLSGASESGHDLLLLVVRVTPTMGACEKEHRPTASH